MERQIGTYDGKFSRKGDIFISEGNEKKCDMCNKVKENILVMSDTKGVYCGAYFCMNCLQNIVNDNKT